MCVDENTKNYPFGKFQLYCTALLTVVTILYIQSSSFIQSCPTLCDPMNHSTPGLPVHHQLLEFTQTHVHRVSDAIQPSHPLSSPSLPAPNPSQHQGLLLFIRAPEFTHTHVHGVSDPIQPSHPLLCLSSPTFSLSQHQGLVFFLIYVFYLEANYFTVL